MTVAAMAFMVCATTGLARADRVEIQVERFGACNAYRGGDVTGIQVRLRSDFSEPISAIVQWDVENADGDMANYWREVTLPPGQFVTRWLYAKLPPISASSLSQLVFNVGVFEAQGARRIRELGTLGFKAIEAKEQSLPLEIQQDAIALVGDGRMGLQDLGVVAGGFEFVPSMNSFTQLPRGISPEEFPDRWEGFWSFNEIIWSQASPQSLTGDRAAALRDWIERGGSLVIVLPESGNPWGIGGGPSNFLSDLLPTKGVTQLDGVPLERLLPALTSATQLLRDNVRIPMYVFDPVQLSAPWHGLIALPESAVTPANYGQINNINDRASMVVRRPFGHGCITLIGVDVNALHSGAYAYESIPQVNVFWNRILGRRADALSANDFDRLQKNVPKKLAIASGYDMYDCGQGEIIMRAIGLQGQVVTSVLATVALFVVYWLVACPIAWMVLRRKNLQKLAWLVFFGVSLLACAGAYGLGLMINTTTTELQHLTVLDTVDESTSTPSPTNAMTRATLWMSALLPGFATAEIALENKGNDPNILTTWAPPTGQNTQRFPDSARFDQAIDVPSKCILPARATTSDFEVRWLGQVAPSWGRLPSQVSGKEVVAITQEKNLNRIALTGSLTHQLPGALKNVLLIHVSPFEFQKQRWQTDQRLAMKPSAPLPNAGRMVELVNDWLPNTEIDLAQALYPTGAADPSKLDTTSLTQEILNRYARPLRQMSARMLSQSIQEVFADASLQTNLQMLSLYQMLEPPAYEMNPPDAPTPNRVTRSLGRSLDLSRWLTQPCLIVLGTLKDAPVPLAINVSGEPAQSNGSVFVRYIIPLPNDEAIFWPPLPVP